MLVTGSEYCILAALCFWSARTLAKQTRKATSIAAVTLSLVGVADCWDLFRDIQTGLSVVGVISFVLIAILLAVILTYLLQSKHEAVA